MSAQLPVARTSFVGRRHDVDAVIALLRRDEAPLITLSGPGGVGKTRLALEVASDIGNDFGDGVCFVDLSSLRDPALVLPAMANALGLRDVGVQSTTGKLIDHLAPRSSLLVLDNLEHVVEAGTGLAWLLSACPRLKIMTTSRVALRVSDEHNLPVQPLDPAAAVQLFVERAKSSAPDFKLTAANEAAIAGICARLDGLPLAIELAAARSAEFEPSTLLEQLDRSLPFLTGGPADQPHRLRTMADAIAWSHELLDASEQALFRRLSIFAGGFDLQRAESVVTALAEPPFDVLDGVASLVEKNLIQMSETPGTGATRYRMLETVREFGAEQLDATGEQAAIAAAYAEHFAALASGTNLGQYSAAFAQTLNALDVEHANAETVLEQTLTTGAFELGLEMVAAMGPYWIFRGHYRDGREWIERFLAAVPNEPTQGRARALVRAGWLANLQGDVPAAEALLSEGIAVAIASGENNMVAQGRIAMSLVMLQKADYPAAASNASESYHLYLELDPGNPNFETWASMALMISGQTASLAGDLDLAADFSSRAMQRLRELPAAWALGASMRVLGDLAHDAGDSTWARSYYRGSIDLAREREDHRLMAETVSGLASLAFKDGDALRAASLYGAVEALREREGIVTGWDRQEHERRIALVRRALPAAEFDTAWARGASSPIYDVLDNANWADSPEESAAQRDGIEQRRDHGLTARELEVLLLLVQGLSNPQIGEALGISKRTAGAHVANLLAKLGLETRTAAAAFAVREGLT